MHVEALKNPAMRGGPFLALPPEQAPSVRALAERTRSERAGKLVLAESIAGLEDLLSRRAQGMSLEPLYQEVPEPLRGYVELVYDLRDHPSVRFLEGLLYRSPHYDESGQSIALSLAGDDEHPFVFGTPRMEDGASVHLGVPFRHGALDELFRIREIARPYGYVRDLFGVSGAEEALFSSLFTDAAPERAAPYTGEGLRVRYYGHACVLVEAQDVSILCDPAIQPGRGSPGSGYTYGDLPEHIDYVLITHGHQDHLLIETLLQLRYKIGTVVVPRGGSGTLADPSLKLILQQIGFRSVLELDEMEAIEIPSGEIVAVPFLGEHGDVNVRAKTGYLVRCRGRSIMLLADANNLEPALFAHVHRALSDVDVLYIGMECDGAPMSWLYGPLLTRPVSRKSDHSRRLNGSDFERAMDIVERMRPRHVYVYAMGQEPWFRRITSIR